MDSINTVIVSGNLTRDIELKYTQSGSAVADMGLAVNNRVKRNGQWEDAPAFLDITLWGRTAEIADEHLHKGSRCCVEGRLTMDRWTDSNGNNRTKIKITAFKMHMLGSKGQQGQQGGQQGGQPHGYVEQIF